MSNDSVQKEYDDHQKKYEDYHKRVAKLNLAGEQIYKYTDKAIALETLLKVVKELNDRTDPHLLQQGEIK